MHLSSQVFLATTTREDGTFVLELPAEPRWSAAWPPGAKGQDGGQGGGQGVRIVDNQPLQSHLIRDDN